MDKQLLKNLKHHANVGFAIILMTPDDVASTLGNEEMFSFRARQNVIFELGFFVGTLGSQGVCALIKGGVEIPSDYSGIVYIKFDQQGGWKPKLVSELRAAGFAVDANLIY